MITEKQEVKIFMYPAIITNDSSGYTLLFPNFNNMEVYNEDIMQVIKNAEERLCSTILDFITENKELPEPTDIFELEIFNETNETKMYITADMNNFFSKNGKSVKKTLSLPSWLKDVAESNNINFSLVLQEELKRRLHIDF